MKERRIDESIIGGWGTQVTSFPFNLLKERGMSFSKYAKIPISRSNGEGRMPVGGFQHLLGLSCCWGTCGQARPGGAGRDSRRGEETLSQPNGDPLAV